MIDSQEKSTMKQSFSAIGGGKSRKAAAWHLPLAELDKITTGKQYDFWRDWLTHDQPEDDWWASGNHNSTVSKITAPNHMVSG
jgi:hypothetical protein